MSENLETRGHFETEKPKKVFVEIGIEGGIFAGPVLFDKNHKHDPDQTYIGVDIRKSAARAVKRKIENQALNNAEVVVADAGKLPFSDKSIDTMYFGNVFGELGSFRKIQQLLAEAKRVITNDGRIIVLETVTPKYAEESGPFEKQLNGAGFDEIVKINGDDQNWTQKLAEYGTSDKVKVQDELDELLKHNRFLITAKPKQENN